MVGEASSATLTQQVPTEVLQQTPSRDITSPSTPVSLCSDSSSVSQNTPLIPDHWRPEKLLTDSGRNEIVRTLVNQLFSRAKKPMRAQCDDCSRKLILKYPMFKDDMGNGNECL